MGIERHALILAILCMLPACDAGNAASEKQQTASRPSSGADKHPSPPDGSKNPDSLPGNRPAIGEALNSQEGLVVEAGNFAFRLKSSDCQRFVADLIICSGNVELRVSTADDSLQQILRPASVVVDAKALAYRGALDEANKPDAHTFVVSDVNGDRHDDLILWSGREGSYGGPSFDVYLFDPNKRELLFSQSFSDLTVGYIGLFSVENGKIRTSSKDGCCLHVNETYVIESNEPKLVERIMEDSSNGEGNVAVKTERLIGGKLQEVEVR